MSRKKKYEKRPFESTGTSSDTSANIYMSMLTSRAWMDLTANQQRLYLYCKAQFYGEKRKPLGREDCFTMNRGKWESLYQLYKRNNSESFYRDMAALIEHGFVRCEECGKTTRTKTVYAFSAKWRLYGTPDFKIELSEMTEGMRKKKRTLEKS